MTPIIIKCLLLFSAVLFGGALAFYVQKNYKTGLNLVLSFTGAYILGISVLHLMPTIYKQGGELIGLWVLLGFFIQLLLEFLSQGVEHGHIHPPHHSKKSFIIQIMLGLCIHAFIEGIPLAFGDEHFGHHHGGSSNHLLYGIIMHKAPAAFALILLLLLSNLKKSTIIFSLIIFASMSPLGIGLGHLLENQNIINAGFLPIILAIVVGSFLHIATTILFEIDDSNHHSFSLKKMLAILFGVGLALLTLV